MSVKFSGSSPLPSAAIRLRIASAITFLLFFCGIYRHDVDRQKYVDLANEPQFASVGEIRLIQGDSAHLRGSCVLIASHYLLTDAHVFDLPSGNGHRRGRPDEFEFRIAGRACKADRISVHPQYLTGSMNEFDIAVVRLADSVPGIVPARVNIESDELHSRIVSVGYGVSMPSIPITAPKVFGEKLAGQNVIDSLGGPLINGQPSLLLADFDSPEHSDATPLEYLTGGGDSGGGLFRQVEGRWELIGLTKGFSGSISPGSGYYGVTVKWTRLSVYDEWIRAAISPE